MGGSKVPLFRILGPLRIRAPVALKAEDRLFVVWAPFLLGGKRKGNFRFPRENPIRF